MIEIWNEFGFKKPAFLYVPSKDVAFVEHLRPSIKSHLSWQAAKGREFAQTAAILSRLMARRKNSFHRMSGYRTILKLNTALCRLLRVDLTRDLQCFYSALPDVVSTDGDSYTELPTQNLCDYVLIRLVGVHHIHQRIRYCCAKAADYFAMMLRENFFLEINTLLLAVFAKLYNLSGLIGNNYVNLYENLMVHRKCFTHHPNSSGENCLPKRFEFPTQLDKFHKLVVDMYDSSSLDGQISSVFSLIPTERKQMLPVVAKRLQIKQDMGIAIHRQPQKKSTFSIAQLTSVKDVKKFIAAECKDRKRFPNNCITKGILDHEWIGAFKLFERKVLAGEQKKALSIFSKFLSTKV